MSDFDKKINKLIMEDELPFEMNPAIQQRLNYQLQLKSSSSRVKQNSIFPFVGDIFSAKLLGWKVSILSIALFFFIGYKQMNNSSTFYSTIDTASIYKTTDTLNFTPNNDSLPRN